NWADLNYMLANPDLPTSYHGMSL
ncbi:hypothetical protein AVEN_2661-2-1, partial [Araneus ventricosus]